MQEDQPSPSFYEFFAGGGMARAGLGPMWRCLFANDFDKKKAETYRRNWGETPLLVEDVANLKSSQITGYPDLAWASFPCQDLSLAGQFRGLAGRRSGTFWPFWNLIRELIEERRGPGMIVLENVCGALTSHTGRDFATIAKALSESSYVFGAMTIDARFWVPQSRPRLFIVAVGNNLTIPTALQGRPSEVWHSNPLRKAQATLPENERRQWIWWNLPRPEPREMALAEILDEDSRSAIWNSPEETDYLISLMDTLHKNKLDAAIEFTKREGIRAVGTAYRRTRNGRQRAEVRFDRIAGCLRTPVGGSSRQTLVIVEDGNVRSRLLTSREAARLMGLPETYLLPDQYNQAYHLCGDGVVVPVVRHLAAHILEPIWVANQNTNRVIAKAA